MSVSQATYDTLSAASLKVNDRTDPAHGLVDAIQDHSKTINHIVIILLVWCILYDRNNRNGLLGLM